MRRAAAEAVVVAEGKVERAKSSRVVKRRSKQMEIVDWAL